MQVLFSLILIFCSIASCLAAAYTGYYADPAHPGKCVIEGLILSPGEIYNSPVRCDKYSCEENSRASFFSCGVVGIPNNCTFGERIHPGALYPDCCQHHIICNDI